MLESLRRVPNVHGQTLGQFGHNAHRIDDRQCLRQDHQRRCALAAQPGLRLLPVRRGDLGEGRQRSRPVVHYGALSGDALYCNYTVGTNDYIHANNGACPSASTAKHVAAIGHEAVYQNDIDLDHEGDFAFAHSDCIDWYTKDPKHLRPNDGPHERQAWRQLRLQAARRDEHDPDARRRRHRAVDLVHLPGGRRPCPRAIGVGRRDVQRDRRRRRPRRDRRLGSPAPGRDVERFGMRDVWQRHWYRLACFQYHERLSTK